MSSLKGGSSLGGGGRGGAGSSSDQFTYIDGVGDELLGVLAGMSIALTLLFVVWLRRRPPAPLPPSANVHHSALLLARAGAGNRPVPEDANGDIKLPSPAAQRGGDMRDEKHSVPAAAAAAAAVVEGGEIEGAASPSVAATPAAVSAEAAAAEQRRMDALRKGIDCPVCLSTAVHAVQTSCGHCFCGSCILRYWERLGRAHQLKCPICRAAIRFVVPSFALRALAADAEAAAAAGAGGAAGNIAPAANPLERAPPAVINAPAEGGGGEAEGRAAADEVRGIDAALDEYNIAWEGRGRSIVQNLNYVGRLRSSFSALPLFSQIFIVLLIIACLGYIISPLDLLPESVLGIFGLVDDLLVIMVTIVLVGLYLRLRIARMNRARYL